MNPTVTRYGAVLDPEGAGELLRAIDGYEGQPITKLAMQLAPHVFVRPGEVRHAEWSEFDFDGALWTISSSKIKMRKVYLVPLSRQAIAILTEAQQLTGPTNYVFPSVRTRRRPMTAHGFRARASTMLNESGKWSPDAIERALAHGGSDKVRAAYHRRTIGADEMGPARDTHGGLLSAEDHDGAARCAQ